MEIGINDYFVIKNAELYPDNKLMIYNRWGNLIYQTTNYKNDWDGSDKEEGTYYYIFIPSTVDSSIPSQKGYVTILR
ncbi:MAG: hypothetical protein Kow0079_10630 [Vicingaceae bacterium]